MLLKLEPVRRSKGMSQAELAKKAGASRSYISELESGKHVPSMVTMCIGFLKARSFHLRKWVESTLFLKDDS